MSKHYKKHVNTVAIVFAVLSTVIALLLVALGVVMVLTDAVNTGNTHHTTTHTTGTTGTPTTIPSQTPPVPEAEYAYPDEMKGVWLTPGIDYLTSQKDTAQKVRGQIDALFTEIAAWKFNTLLLPMHLETEAIYPTELLESRTLTDKDGSVFQPLQYILEKAREHNLYVYGIVDLHIRHEELWDPRVEGDNDRILQAVTEQVSLYEFDGYFLSGFTFAGVQVPEGEEPVAEAALNALIPRVVKAIQTVNRDHYVGLLSNGVWAHASVDERGSDTAEYYEEFTDGRADTLSWIEQGLFQCVLVQDYNSTNHPTAPFQKILNWWSGVAQQQQIALYISHSANSIGSNKTGWKLPDQLAQQYLYCKADSAWKGSAYDSLAALKKDTGGLADTLKKAYEGKLNEEFIYKTLAVTSPNKTSFTTTSSTVKFEGGGDTNFPLTINGQGVTLSDHGFFTETYTLKIGVNTFKFTHKGVTKTYTVTYKQTLLESVSPAETMKVDGGNTFIISAVGRVGSTLKATLGSQTITLKEVPGKDDETATEPTDFRTFSGSLTLPAGVVGKTQSLGNVSVTATYNGISETLKGGKITINALPEDQKNYEIVVVTTDYAETFSGGKLKDDYSRPYNSFLPKGTQDYLEGKVYNGSYSYYLLASGKRVYMKDAKLINAKELKKQPLTSTPVQITDSHTKLTFDAGWQVPVYVAAYPQKYYKDSTSSKPNYGLEKYGQTAEYVDVTFHYITDTPTAPDMSVNPLFSASKWIKNDEDTYTLRLTLRKKGGFYGFSLIWTDNNTLSLSFLNPVNITANTGAEKLKGIRILIDPGHGSEDDKPWEGPFNLEYAFVLKEKLEALGATVDMTRTTALDKKLELATRTQMAHNRQYHMFISVHMNGANGKATGASVWYYHEYAYTASKLIYDQMHAVETTYGVGTTANGTPRYSGTSWGTLYLNRTIFDCPAVLVECAFLDNPKDKECLIDPIYRDKLMQATVEGVIQYFSAQSS